MNVDRGLYKALATAFLLFALLTFGSQPASFAYFVDEILPIRWIIDHAFRYLEDHPIRFAGTVKAILAEPSAPTGPCLRSRGYVAVIEDETGTIEAVICGEPSISVGQHVVIRGLLSVVNAYKTPPIIYVIRVVIEPPSQLPE